MDILMVYPKFLDTFWPFPHALRYIGKKAAFPLLGLITVAALPPKEFEKRLVDLNVDPDAKTQAAVTLAIYGFHFRKIAEPYVI